MDKGAGKQRRKDTTYTLKLKEQSYWALTEVDSHRVSIAVVVYRSLGCRCRGGNKEKRMLVGGNVRLVLYGNGLL